MQFPGTNYVEDLGEHKILTMSMRTILAHSSGEWISHEMSMPIAKVDAQGAGSVLTYMLSLIHI